MGVGELAGSKRPRLNQYREEPLRDSAGVARSAYNRALYAHSPMKRPRPPTIGFAVAFILLCCSLWLYSTLIGWRAVYNGQRVAPKSQWYAYSLVLPIPTGLASRCYAYRDQTGTLIWEGPCVKYYPNGKLRVRSNYLHGQLDGKESIFNEAGIELSRIYWNQDKIVRQIQCPCVDP